MAFKKAGSAIVDAVRPELEGFAKILADRLWGAKGPAWGTTLTEIEDIVVAVRDALGEKMLHNALQRQAAESAERPVEFRHCHRCGLPTDPREPEPRFVQTRGGGGDWQEPHEHGTRCRRAFSPSVEKPGD